jgi:hypothetical protein
MRLRGQRFQRALQKVVSTLDDWKKSCSFSLVLYSGRKLAVLAFAVAAIQYLIYPFVCQRANGQVCNGRGYCNIWTHRCVCTDALFFGTGCDKSLSDLYNPETNQFCEGLGEPITLIANSDYRLFDFVASVLRQCHKEEPDWFTEACVDRIHEVFILSSQIPRQSKRTIFWAAGHVLDDIVSKFVVKVWFTFYQW